MYANSHVVLVEVEPSNPGEAATVENLSLRAQRIAEVEQQSTEQVENRSSGELARQQGHSMSTDRILRYAFLTSDNSPLVLLHDLKARQPEKQADIIGANGGFHAYKENLHKISDIFKSIFLEGLLSKWRTSPDQRNWFLYPVRCLTPMALASLISFSFLFPRVTQSRQSYRGARHGQVLLRGGGQGVPQGNPHH
mmetsp:Transcript_65715/g.122943  ORF Transcript_65715/g.122943 Transcript_65715/m.122943 type:complete len:195 (-) Transcript_65715:72-656(-)